MADETAIFEFHRNSKHMFIINKHSCIPTVFLCQKQCTCNIIYKPSIQGDMIVGNFEIKKRVYHFCVEGVKNINLYRHVFYLLC